jgi:anti-sigma factor RsiW
MTHHPVVAISAYADGELTEQEEAQVKSHLANCTECARELALIRSMGAAMADNMRDGPRRPGVWERVQRRIAQPIGWLLFTGGLSVWVVLLIIEWFRAGDLSLRWMATTAIGIGIGLVAVGIAYEQYREWRHSPYKDLER